jgi:hypothetical protein
MEDRGTFIYRCRNCKKKHSPISYPDAMDAAIKTVRKADGDNEFNGYNMFSIHRCLNGNLGISDLIAVETTDKEKHKRLARLS